MGATGESYYNMQGGPLGNTDYVSAYAHTSALPRVGNPPEEGRSYIYGHTLSTTVDYVASQTFMESLGMPKAKSGADGTYNPSSVSRASWGGGVSTTPVSVVVRYRMKGMDALTDGLYDTWNVTTSPDFSASQYSGGLNTPLRDVTALRLPDI